MAKTKKKENAVEVIEERNLGGRPTKFNEEIRDTIMMLTAAGKTDKEIAKEIGVAESTYHLWKKHIGGQFSESIKKAKSLVDDMVVAGLLSKAVGAAKTTEQKAIVVRDQTGPNTFTERVEVIEVEKQSIPDTAAQIFWLKNRRPKEWRDKVDVGVEPIDDMEF